MWLTQKIILISIIPMLYCCGIKNKVGLLSGESNVLIECGAEQWAKEQFVDNSGKYKLSNANGRTKEQKRTGEYSLKLTQEVPYGMAIILDNIKSDDFISVTVWQKGNGHICASDDIPDSFYKAENKPVLTDSLGWQKICLEFFVPYSYRSTKIKILLCNFGNEPVYFDDLIIEKERIKTFPSFEKEGVMNIFISEKNFQKLSIKRQKALDEGLLVTADDDWVKAIVFYKDQVLDTKLRLKGDRLDHLNGRKWSFRIKIKGKKAWHGMKTFSIQTPSARNFLHEWFFHQALEKEDILCTKYGFVPVVLNGQSLGMYAWEEHFEKHLIESRNRREGPILKLSDDSYWIYDKINRQKEINYSVPSYDASVVLPFNQKRISADSLLLNEFRFGRDLYYQYKYAKADVSDIFDVEKIAKYYAMTDATNAYHTLHFFNQRFYYNPVLGKLEPIFFDSFADVGIFDFYGKDLIVENAENVWLSIHLKLFSNPEFKDIYFKYLKKYSSNKFWKSLYTQNKEELRILNSNLKLEYSNYNFDINVFYDIARNAEIALSSLKEIEKQKDLFSKFRDRSASINKNYTGKADFEIIPHLINIYTQDSHTFQIENYSTDTISILGFSDIPQMLSEQIEEDQILPPANSKGKFIVRLKSKNEGHKYIFIKIRDKKISIPIIPWDAPNTKLKHYNVLHSFKQEDLSSDRIAKFIHDTVLISGNITIKNNLVIPGKRVVIFEKGTSVDLINGATFISYSPVFINGTQKYPVTFHSSDGTGKGFNIFQANKRSKVKHAIFNGLTNFDFNGWVTTGCVCFYESDVDFQNVRIENNFDCDDALNIIRSDYLVKDCIFEQTYADAFDSDFCTGKIISTQFLSPGNDAIDFSGSKVSVLNCTVLNAEDKSVSCGENSKIHIMGCTFDGGNIGVASKDKSKVTIEDSEISNVIYGMVVFCKKPEYGSATIRTNNLILKKYLFIHLIEEGSMLNFNNREIFGQEKNLAGRFY